MKYFLFDFSRVLLFPKDRSYRESLNGLHRSLKDIPNYNSLDYFDLNSEVLDFLEKNKDKSKFYILTSETVQDDPNIANKLGIFTNVFSAAKIGLSKTNPKIYKYVAQIMSVPTSEITFTDDSSKNIETAKVAGLDTILYTDNQTLLHELEKRF